jgi:hypothetical protein
MDDSIVRLYPLPSEEAPLRGTYLGQRIRQEAEASEKAFVYANFVVSLVLSHSGIDG